MAYQPYPFYGKLRKIELMPFFRSKQRIIDMFPPECCFGTKKRNRYVHVNNGAPVLLVAHMDTVISPRLDKVNTGAGFDDRLGVFAATKLCSLFPQYFDLLLTDYEENGSSTAGNFVPKHPYNLVVGLDREGTGFVDYGLASDSLQQTLNRYGLEEHLGSFSDICFLFNMNCNMFNIGLGIYSSHSPQSGFVIHDFKEQMKKLLFFVEDNHSVVWPVVEKDDDWARYYSSTSPASYNKYSLESGYYMRCEVCEQYYPQDDLYVVDGDILCESCVDELYAINATQLCDKHKQENIGEQP
jgi:hypothetical protein